MPAMNPTERLLQRLSETQGDTQAQAAVIAEFTIETRPEAERERLTAALDAAAVLHWFDAELLGQILQLANADARHGYVTLKSFPFVECYSGKGDGPRNLHEATRLGWRKKLAEARPDRFRELSRQAAACFADAPSPAARIEWIYHRLCGNPELGATELENLDRDWSNWARPEDRYALASTLRELVDSGLVAGRAMVWCQLVMAWARCERGEAAQLAAMAANILTLARINSDHAAQSDAHSLYGDVMQAQGKLEAAQAAFAEALSIRRHLAEQNPSNAGWQRELAVAHSRVGDVLEAQGNLEAALAAFGESLAISRRLAEQDPSNADWQRDLALALLRTARMASSGSRQSEAVRKFRRAKQIFERLVALAPGHAGWNEELEAISFELLMAEHRSRKS